MTLSCSTKMQCGPNLDDSDRYAVSFGTYRSMNQNPNHHPLRGPYLPFQRRSRQQQAPKSTNGVFHQKYRNAGPRAQHDINATSTRRCRPISVQYERRGRQTTLRPSRQRASNKRRLPSRTGPDSRQTQRRTN
jgi:hypothetical protein